MLQLLPHLDPRWRNINNQKTDCLSCVCVCKRRYHCCSGEGLMGFAWCHLHWFTTRWEWQLGYAEYHDAVMCLRSPAETQKYFSHTSHRERCPPCNSLTNNDPSHHITLVCATLQHGSLSVKHARAADDTQYGTYDYESDDFCPCPCVLFWILQHSWLWHNDSQSEGQEWRFASFILPRECKSTRHFYKQFIWSPVIFPYFLHYDALAFVSMKCKINSLIKKIQALQMFDISILCKNDKKTKQLQKQVIHFLPGN